jgi:hypothetical protein
MIRVSFVKFGGGGGGSVDGGSVDGGSVGGLSKVLLLLFLLLWLLWLGSILFSTKYALFPPILVVDEFALLSVD